MACRLYVTASILNLKTCSSEESNVCCGCLFVKITLPVLVHIFIWIHCAQLRNALLVYLVKQQLNPRICTVLLCSLHNLYFQLDNAWYVQPHETSFKYHSQLAGESIFSSRFLNGFLSVCKDAHFFGLRKTGDFFFYIKITDANAMQKTARTN